MARSFGLHIFEAGSVEDLSAEQYNVLVAALNAAVAAGSAPDRTVSIRTRR